MSSCELWIVHEEVNTKEYFSVLDSDVVHASAEKNEDFAMMRCFLSESIISVGSNSWAFFSHSCTIRFENDRDFLCGVLKEFT